MTPIVLGILVATLANHAFAGAVGSWLTSLMEPRTLQWVLGVSFLAMALWTLIPDKLDADDAKLAGLGVFGTTLMACRESGCRLERRRSAWCVF